MVPGPLRSFGITRGHRQNFAVHQMRRASGVANEESECVIGWAVVRTGVQVELFLSAITFRRDARVRALRVTAHPGLNGERNARVAGRAEIDAFNPVGATAREG